MTAEPGYAHHVPEGTGRLMNAGDVLCHPIVIGDLPECAFDDWPYE